MVNRVQSSATFVDRKGHHVSQRRWRVGKLKNNTDAESLAHEIGIERYRSETSIYLFEPLGIEKSIFAHGAG